MDWEIAMKNKRRKNIEPLTYGVLCLLFFLAIGSLSSVNAAATYTFSRITSNTPDGYDLPEITMWVDEFTCINNDYFFCEILLLKKLLKQIQEVCSK